jgi:hypothetical protein
MAAILWRPGNFLGVSEANVDLHGFLVKRRRWNPFSGPKNSFLTYSRQIPK